MNHRRYGKAKNMYGAPKRKLPRWILKLAGLIAVVGAAFLITLFWQSREATRTIKSDIPPSYEDKTTSEQASDEKIESEQQPENPSAEDEGYLVRSEYSAAVREKANKAEVTDFEHALFVGGQATLGIADYLQPEYAKIKVLANKNIRLENVATYSEFKNIKGESVTLLEAAEKFRGIDRVYLMLGEDDLALSPEEFADYYKGLAIELKKVFPKAKIYLQSIMPVGDKAQNEIINARNTQIMQIAAQGGMYYLDVAVVLLDSDGEFIKDAAPDGRNFTGSYYFRWFDYLRWHYVG